MSLIPMQFGFTNKTVEQTHHRKPLQLSPTSRSVHFSQPSQFSNRIANGDDFDIGNITQNLKIHRISPEAFLTHIHNNTHFDLSPTKSTMRTITHMFLKLTRRDFLMFAVGSTAMAINACQPKCALESLEIIPRADWGALLPNIEGSVEGTYDAVANPGGWYTYTEPLANALNTIIIHHSALPLSDGPREIQKKHTTTKGYADIAYHFVIDAAGNIYEGRDIYARGAHTGGHNTGTIGIVLLGNFEETTPLEIQMTQLETLSRCLKDTYAITHIAGHRDFQPGVTVCPGDNLEARIPELARDLNLEFGTAGYTGPL